MSIDFMFFPSHVHACQFSNESSWHSQIQPANTPKRTKKPTPKPMTKKLLIKLH